MATLSDVADQIHDGLLVATQAASDTHRGPLSNAIGELAQYLNSIVEAGGLNPSPEQWSELRTLESATLTLLREERATPVVVALRPKRTGSPSGCKPIWPAASG